MRIPKYPGRCWLAGWRHRAHVAHVEEERHAVLGHEEAHQEHGKPEREVLFGIGPVEADRATTTLTRDPEQV
jgi:hypothetical protein